MLVPLPSGGARPEGVANRGFDFKRVKAKIWYMPLIFLMPCIMVLSSIVIGLMGVPLPTPQFSIVTILTLFVVFFIAALGEELD